MSWKVIHHFTDSQDSGYKYKVGDKFPRLGKTVSDERIKELSGRGNRQKMPVIEFVKDKAKQVEIVENVEEVSVEKETVYTKTDINRMSVQDLRTLAMAQGFEDVEENTGAELKKMLIEKLGL